MSQRTPQICALGFVFTLLMSASSQADGSVDQFRTKMEKWVETRQLVSQERSEWLVDQEFLTATRDLLRKERDALRIEIEELDASHTGSGEERRVLTLERGEYQRVALLLEDELRVLESQVLRVVPRLPVPLKKRLEPLLVQIPEDPETASTPLGQRLMNVLGVLAQTEKFNSTATLVGETKSVGGQQKVQVRTLYWGLGQAVSVDAQGRTAGISRPTERGWEFKSDPEFVDDAKLLLDIYEGNVDTIAFISVPAEIQ